MPTWDSLTSNQLVSNDALTSAIMDRYFALKAGQSLPSGNKCITSGEAATLLQLDESILPSNADQLVTRSELRGAQTVSVRVKIDENGATTGVNFIDCDVYLGVDGINIDGGFFFSPFDQTFGPYYGGQSINLVLQSQSDYSSPGVTNGKIQMQLYEGGEGGTLLMDTGPIDAPVHGSGVTYTNVWPTSYRMLPNTQYFVKAWSFILQHFTLYNYAGIDMSIDLQSGGYSVWVSTFYASEYNELWASDSFYPALNQYQGSGQEGSSGFHLYLPSGYSGVQIAFPNGSITYLYGSTIVLSYYDVLGWINSGYDQAGVTLIAYGGGGDQV